MASFPGLGQRSRPSYGMPNGWIAQPVSPQRVAVVRNRPGSIVAGWLESLSSPSRLPVVASTSRDALSTLSPPRGC
jgi:hypothetical protein